MKYRFELKTRSKITDFQSIKVVMDELFVPDYLTERDLDRAKYFFAYPEGSEIHAGFSMFSLDKSQINGYIYCLYVVEKHRKKGLGSKLLKETENEIEKQGVTAYLYSLERRIPFYKKRGYRSQKRKREQRGSWMIKRFLPPRKCKNKHRKKQ